MDEPILNLLHKEHEDVMTTINQIQPAYARDLKTVEDRWNAVKQQLVPHLIAEEDTFYSVLKNMPKSMNYAQQSHEQHRGLESDIFEINSIPLTDTDTWMARFNSFKTRFQQHVQFEESIIFDEAGELLSQSQLQDIMDKYQKAEVAAKKSTIEGRYEAGFLV